MLKKFLTVLLFVLTTFSAYSAGGGGTGGDRVLRDLEESPRQLQEDLHAARVSPRSAPAEQGHG